MMLWWQEEIDVVTGCFGRVIVTVRNFNQKKSPDIQQDLQGFLTTTEQIIA
jgi:hypothetical protein